MNHDVEREKNMITNEEAEKAQGILTQYCLEHKGKWDEETPFDSNCESCMFYLKDGDEEDTKHRWFCAFRCLWLSDMEYSQEETTITYEKLMQTLAEYLGVEFGEAFTIPSYANDRMYRITPNGVEAKNEERDSKQGGGWARWKYPPFDTSYDKIKKVWYPRINEEVYVVDVNHNVVPKVFTDETDLAVYVKCKNVFQTKEKAATIANIGKAFEGLMD